MSKIFDKGLLNLKTYIEALPADCKAGEIQVVNVTSASYITMKKTLRMEEIGPFHQEAFGKLFALAMKMPASKSLCFPASFYEGDPTLGQFVAIAAVPVAKQPKSLPEGVSFLSVPASKAACVSHWGSYETVSDTYYKLEDYIKANNLEVAGNPWEEYITNPGNEPDPMKWETKIYFPVK